MNQRVLIAAALMTVAAGCKQEAAQTPPAAADPNAAEHAAAPVAAAEPAQPAPQPPTAAQIERPLLWKVTAPSGGTGYLLGTMHLGIDAEKQLPPVVWEALTRADLFAMEMDVTDPKLLALAVRSDGTTLREELGEATWKKLEDELGKAMAAGLNGMKPAAAAALLLVQGLPMTPSMDLTLRQKAAAAAKELVFLEEVEFQQELLEEFMTADYVTYLLEDLGEVRDAATNSLEAYQRGDAEALGDSILDPAQWQRSGKGAIDKMLYRRNAAWVPQIRALIARGTPFVAVGAGHLVGKRSVVDLLRRKGYRVERLAADDT